MYNLIVYFLYILCCKNILILIGKVYDKYSYIIDEVVAVLAHCDKVINKVREKHDRVETNCRKDDW